MIILELDGGARALFTDRADGDMGHGGRYVTEVAPEVEARRRAVLPLPWTWLRQVHSDVVRSVEEPGGAAGATGDALVADQPGCALAVLTADCAPVVLSSPEGVVGVAHAGWRGMAAGVVDRAAEVMHASGASAIDAVVGPCIRPDCYEFGADDLERVVSAVGPEVRGRTAAGRPALDLVAGLRACLARVGARRVVDIGVCTACTPDYFSWRARREHERQATVVWR